MGWLAILEGWCVQGEVAGLVMGTGPKEKKNRIQTTTGYLLSTGISDYGKPGLICGQGNVPPPPPRN